MKPPNATLVFLRLQPQAFRLKRRSHSLAPPLEHGQQKQQWGISALPWFNILPCHCSTPTSLFTNILQLFVLLRADIPVTQ